MPMSSKEMLKLLKEKRIRGDQSEWFTCKVEEFRNW